MTDRQCKVWNDFNLVMDMFINITDCKNATTYENNINDTHDDYREVPTTSYVTSNKTPTNCVFISQSESRYLKV